jgi:hypothetical protein
MNKEHSEQAKGKCLRSRQEQQVRKEVTQREGRSWEKTEEEKEKMQEERKLWRGLVVRISTSSGSILGRRFRD